MENSAYAVPAGRSDGGEGMGGAAAPGNVRTDPPASAAATSTTGGDGADGGESGGGDNSRRGDGRVGAAGLDASLFAAAAAGDTEQVEALLNDGAWSLVELPMAGGGCPRTPLMAAAAAGHREAVAFLVQVLASTVVAFPASDGETALTLALRGGHTGVAETILGPAEDLEDCPPVNVAGADGATPLLVAAATGADAVVKRLLVLKSRGGEGMTPANVWAVTDAGESAMHLAVNGGHTGALKELVRSDAFDAALWIRNTLGLTAFHEALLANQSDHHNLLNALSLRWFRLQDRPVLWRSLLIAGVLGGRVDVGREQLDHAARGQLLPWNKPPSSSLDLAVEAGRARMVRALLGEAGARPRYTHLRDAASRGHFKVLTILLDALQPQPLSGDTRRDLASMLVGVAAGAGHLRIARFLVEWAGPGMPPPPT